MVSSTNKINRIKELVYSLNKYSNSYYNENKSLISDKEYDELYDELAELEIETGVILSNSPTQRVGYEIESELSKVKHSHPMLSLAKTQKEDELLKFIGDKNCMLMCKMDGLTILLTYDNGKLIQAETRGNGIEGEIITHNARVFTNIPLEIPYKGRYEIEGEAVISYDDFEKINKDLSDDKKFKNPRNLASGSVRQLDSKIAASRSLKFIAWKVPTDVTDINKTMYDRLCHAIRMGFDVVPYVMLHISSNIESSADYLKSNIEWLKEWGKTYPIDGLVCSYNDIEYGLSLGSTGHHPKHSIAFKFYDEVAETTLRDIRWTIGKTGVLTPTAIFDPVELEGTTVQKATLCNLSIMEKLGVTNIGQTIGVFKAHQIIPQVAYAHKSDKVDLTTIISAPSECPECGVKTIVNYDEMGSRFLKCSNPYCSGRFIKRLTHFVSRDAMNIDGLSEANIRAIYDCLDEANKAGDGIAMTLIYHIMCLNDNDKAHIKEIQGFGEKKVEKLFASIEKSKCNVSLEKFLYALSIPNIGKSASKTISKYFNGNFNALMDFAYNKYNDWTFLDDIGEALSNSLNEYFNSAKGCDELMTFKQILSFKTSEGDKNIDKIFEGKSFCITGSLNIYPNRQALLEDIEKYGGKVVSGVSKKTDYLLTNDTTSGSSKNVKAAKLGIPIISEDDFIKMLKKIF